MRCPGRSRAATAAKELQMGPLIDCVFLLLTYFLFTISLATIEGLLPSELALGSEQQERTLDLESEEDEVVVRVVSTGEGAQYFVDDWPVGDFAAVAEHLAGVPKGSLVVIDAGTNVAYEHVMRLYNQCLRANIERVVFPVTGATGVTGDAPRS